MTMIKRRLLAAFFVLSFLIVSPMFILYASGYRLNWQKKQFERVGLLFVSAEPKDSTVTVNEQDYTINGELLIDDLRPNKYTVTITHENYYPWTKTLAIEEGKSTFIQSLQLFKKDIPQEFQTFDQTLVPLGENESFRFYQLGATLISFNKENQQLSEISLESNTAISTLEYISKQENVTFLQDTIWYNLNTTTNALSTIETFTEADQLKKVLATDTSFYLLNETGVLEVNRADKQLRTITNSEYTVDVFPKDNGFWLMSSEPGKQRVFLYDLSDTTDRPTLLTAFPYSDNIKIVDAVGKFMTVFDQKNNIVYLVDGKTLPATVESIFGVKKWQWSKDHQSILTASEFEVTIHHIKNGINQELLLRVSTPITDIAWYTNEAYVIYSTTESVYLVERDTRDKKNIVQITQDHNDVQILSVDKEGKKLFFSSNNQNVGTTIWQQSLKD